jgi:hypothetical protein
MKIELSGDELLLAIIGLVRRVNPSLLRPEGDGFAVDLTPLAGKSHPTGDEQLLLKLRAVSDAGAGSVDLGAGEARALASALAHLEMLQKWPADVTKMSQDLRLRLARVG